jgi:hypothetical protein
LGALFCGQTPRSGPLERRGRMSWVTHSLIWPYCWSSPSAYSTGTRHYTWATYGVVGPAWREIIPSASSSSLPCEPVRSRTPPWPAEWVGAHRASSLPTSDIPRHSALLFGAFLARRLGCKCPRVRRTGNMPLIAYGWLSQRARRRIGPCLRKWRRCGCDWLNSRTAWERQHQTAANQAVLDHTPIYRCATTPDLPCFAGND